MDEQNTSIEPTLTPEPTAPAVEQTAQTEATAEVTQAPPEPQTAQVPPNEPLADPVPEVTQSPSTQAPALPEPASQPLPMSAQAPVIVIQNRIKDFFAKAAAVIQERKRKKLDRILALFTKKTHITNDEVEKLLHVSDATATRYLSQLEKQGKIKQGAKTGKDVTYTKL